MTTVMAWEQMLLNERPCMYTKQLPMGAAGIAMRTYVVHTHYAIVRTGLRGGSAGGGPRPADVGGLGVWDGVGHPDADADAEAEAEDGDDDEGSRDSLRSAVSDDSWLGEPSAASAPRVASEVWPGDEGALVGGVPVSEARFSLSFETIDCSAAEAREAETEVEGADDSPSDGREISCLLWTLVGAARGGSGGGTGRGGNGPGEVTVDNTSSVASSTEAESWSWPVKPVCDTGVGSLRVAVAEPNAGFFNRRYMLCNGAFFGSSGTAGGGGA